MPEARRGLGSEDRWPPGPGCGRRAWAALPLLAAAAVALTASPAVGQAGTEPGPFRGPLHFQERNPLYRLFLSPTVHGADVVEPGRLSVRLGFGYSNIFELSESRRHRQYFDLERLGSTLTVAYGIAEGWEVGGRVGAHSSWGGFLDPLIQGYHELLSLRNGSRDAIRNNAFGLRLVRDGRTELDVPAGSYLEDIRLHVQGLLAGGRDGPGTLGVRVQAKLPTGAASAGTGRADAAVHLLGRRSWAPWHVHGSLGVVTLSAPAGWEPFVHRAGLVYSVAAERAVGSNVSALVQLSGSSAYVGGFGASELDHVPMNVVLGAAGEAWGWSWEAGFAEDVVPNGPAVDFSVHLEIGRVF